MQLVRGSIGGHTGLSRATTTLHPRTPSGRHACHAIANDTTTRIAPSPSHAPGNAVAAAVVSTALLLGGMKPALAFGPVSVTLEGVTVTEVPCGTGTSSVGGVTFSGQTSKAACLSVTATATNPSKKPLYNADVFGRVYDANGEAAIDDTENIRIAYLDEVKPGTSDVAFKLFIPREQFDLGPLKLKGFKATGFPGKMLPNQGSGLIGKSEGERDCEITGDCDDDESTLIR